MPVEWVSWALQALIVAGIIVIWVKIESNATGLNAFRLKYAEEALTKEDFKPYRQFIHDFRDYLQQEKGKEILRKEIAARNGNQDA
jgi:uncharacterized membrane protein